jgi:two-component system, NarL family, response regulator LiaR
VQSINVVLIEDHHLTRMGIRTVLKQSGWINIVGEAANGLEGLQLLEMTQPDVAIVDIGLPGMNGIDLTQQYKAVPSEPDLSRRVLMLTLQDQKESVLAAFGAGADSYCLKDDIKLDNLLEALRVTAQGYSWVDPTIAGIILQHNRQRQGRKPLAYSQNTVAIEALGADHNQLLESYPLTERELEVLELIVNGNSNDQIAQQLYITVGTVKTHVRNILNKLCADDRTQAAVLALRAGLIS